MYRHEEKYLINLYQLEIIKNNLKAIMQLDKNHLNGAYFVRSLYFDDFYETSYNQVVNGISNRYKYRIRYYNYNKDYINLEKKEKQNNLGNKKMVSLTKKQVESIINCEEIKEDNELLREFNMMIKTKLLKSLLIIDYDRISFVYEPLNIRITIDYNISASYDIKDFFNKKINSFPIIDKNTAVLEVKYDLYLPKFIKNALNLDELTITSFSKYKQGKQMLDVIKGVDNYEF